MSRSRYRPRYPRSAARFSVHVPYCDECGRNCACKRELRAVLKTREKRRAAALMAEDAADAASDDLLTFIEACLADALADTARQR